jgi:hypothetical protein
MSVCFKTNTLVESELDNLAEGAKLANIAFSIFLKYQYDWKRKNLRIVMDMPRKVECNLQKPGRCLEIKL